MAEHRPGAACLRIRRSRAQVELADIVRARGEGYRAMHRGSLVQTQALAAIGACRTAALGGARYACAQCGFERLVYRSCLNRHCPKCQTLAKERWLQARRAELLPLPYFHVVFTLPHALNPLAQGNPRVIYRLLFQAASETLLEFGANPRWLEGGEIGITLVLHTWGQNLNQHLHVHCLVAGGALTPHGFVRAKPGFLFPVKALSKVFRGKYLQALSEARAELRLAGKLAEAGALLSLLGQLKREDWVVYAKRPFAGPQTLLDYLGRYTHCVAIGNHRLLSFDGDMVRFRWRDYAHGNKHKVMALEADEFIRRFLLHVLPKGFMRIRHYGFLANRTKAEKLARCRGLLDAPPPLAAPPETLDAFLLRVIGSAHDLCPACHTGRLQLLAPVAPYAAMRHDSLPRGPPH
jgi:hypothetical protein